MMGLILSWQGSLKTVEVLDTHSGINGLVSSFVKLLQEENASRECTIVRTAGRLTPFDFNRMPEESFCPICSSPLSKSDLLNLNDVENGQLSAEAFGATCCLSWQFQILPKEPSLVEHFYSLYLSQSLPLQRMTMIAIRNG
ncbi:hypothetical protein Vadar_019136 [Vaccinium darrowii]|uniref:Uncharacterized protein n=1 Tax=Vaccinium darrowii TaxID=229202 RepID=A0ACB7YP41_9ERIC|nr:hypothetical protein Vadar_019136 [Vaccinium darrowii]